MKGAATRHDAQARLLGRNLDQACKILGGDKATTLREVSRNAARIWGMRHRFPMTVTKKQKIAAKSFERALRLLETASKNPELAYELRDGFPEIDFKRWRDKIDAAVTRDLWMAKDGNDYCKLYAARRAALLLTAHNIPLKLTRKGDWCRLAAILWGEPEADFLHHCRLAKAELIAGPDVEPVENRSG